MTPAGGVERASIALPSANQTILEEEMLAERVPIPANDLECLFFMKAWGKSLHIFCKTV